MPRLYGCHRSRALRVLWIAEEAGIALDLVPVVQARRVAAPEAEGAPLNTRSPDFLALNPMGAIPVWEEGGLRLTESLAILMHLARRAGELGPWDDVEEAQMLQWLLFGATSIETAALVIQNANGADPEAAERLARPFAVLDAHLAQEGQLVGGRFTAADIGMAEIVRYAQGDAGLMARHPALDAWLRRAQARPAFQAVWARREAEPPTF
jgi:glutathione S-transferase